MAGKSGRLNRALRRQLPASVRAQPSARHHAESHAALLAHATPIVNELGANLVCVKTDFGTNPIKAKIQDAEQLRVHTMLVIGGRDMDARAVSVRLHGKGPQGAKPKAEEIAEIVASVKERRA